MSFLSWIRGNRERAFMGLVADQKKYSDDYNCIEVPLTEGVSMSDGEQVDLTDVKKGQKIYLYPGALVDIHKHRLEVETHPMLAEWCSFIHVPPRMGKGDDFPLRVTVHMDKGADLTKLPYLLRLYIVE